ncbi:MAG: translocation/assembly module TamB domain-containing protein, partial [Bacteroidales bacterium]
EFRLMVDGSWDGNQSVNARLDGHMARFTLNGYRFRDLDINGLASGRTYEATLVLRDPNINLELDGRADLGGVEPEYDFNLVVAGADLAALNIDKRDSVSRIDLRMEGRLIGRNLDEMNGEILITNSVYENSRGKLPVSELSLISQPDLGRRKLTLSSEYIDARVIGYLHAVDLVTEGATLISRFIPALSVRGREAGAGKNDFSFNVHLKNPGPVTDILTPSFQCKDNSRISGSYSSAGRSVYLEGTSPQFVVGGSQFTNFNFQLGTEGDRLLLTADLAKLQLDKNTYFEDMRLTSSVSDNLLEAGLNWNNTAGFTNSGGLTCQALFEPDEEGKVSTTFRFPAAEINFRDSIWQIDPFELVLKTGLMKVDQLIISHNRESMTVSGAISANPSDTLFLAFNQLNLNNINQITQARSFEYGGRLSGTARLFNLRSKGMFLADMAIDSLIINGETLGHTVISSRSDGSGEPVYMDLISKRGAINTIKLQGSFNPVNDSLDFNLALDKLRLNLANPFVAPDLQDIRGLGSGQIRITGTPGRPELNGSLLMQKASFLVDYLNTRFFFTHTLEITPYAFWVSNLDIQDEEGNHAQVNGGVRHDHLKNILFDFALNFQDFILVNTTEARNDGYWGRAYATGTGTIRGALPNLAFDIRARTARRTRFYVPVSVTGEAREIDFITFVEAPNDDYDGDLLDFTVKKRTDYEVKLYGVSVGLDLEVTPDAEVQLIFDSKVGDVIRGRGSGNLRIAVAPSAGLSLTGDFTLEQGDYQLTLQNMPVKRFEIEPGGTIKWTGDVANAQLDIDAVYRTKASLFDLLQDESNSDLMQRIPVECHLLMTGYLESPGFRFNIILPPNSNELARSQLQNLTEEDMNKQVIALLILGRFMPLQGFASGTSRGYESAGISTTTEVLSNQLNYWLSQISNDVDIGLNYRPGDELTSDEVEVALSTQLLNNRMTINVNGNYDVRPVNASANQLVGDVEVEYKIRPSGKLRVKAFTRANDHLLYEYAPYTQGVGLFFREEFDSFAELFGRYWDRLGKKQEKQ